MRRHTYLALKSSTVIINVLFIIRFLSKTYDPLIRVKLTFLISKTIVSKNSKPFDKLEK